MENKQGENMVESVSAPVRLAPHYKKLAGKIKETGKYGTYKEVAENGIRLLAEKEGLVP